MVKYQCLRCNFETKIKTKFLKHLNRKFICEPINSNISIGEIYNKYFITEVAKCSQNIAKMLPKYSQNIASKVANSKELIKVYKCKYCDRSFSHSSSKYKHEKNRCKKKKGKKSEEEKIRKKVIKEMKKEGRLIDPPTEQKKIKLNPFSKTDRSHITDRDYLMAIKKGNMGIPFIIEKIYFNENKPENHNICMTSTKNGYVRVYTELNGWEYQLANEVINYLVEDNANIIEDRISEWKKVESDSEDTPKLLPGQKTKHQIMEDDNLDVIDVQCEPKVAKKPKHKYGADKYQSTLDKFPRLLDRISKSNYVRKLVHDRVRLILYNKRKYAMDIERQMKTIAK